MKKNDKDVDVFEISRRLTFQNRYARVMTKPVSQVWPPTFKFGPFNCKPS